MALGPAKLDTGQIITECDPNELNESMTMVLEGHNRALECGEENGFGVRRLNLGHRCTS